MTINRRALAVLAGALLLAAFLRWADLAEMADLLSYDEAYNLADAAALVDQPRLTPFLPGNNGRESGWMYLLAVAIAGGGPSPFVARFAAASIGILAVAAVYRLGRELFDVRIGIGAALGMAVLYWPVHFSHLILRANLLPFLGALGLALLLTAQRRNRMSDWFVAGLAVGATAYTYLAAQLWVALELLILIAWIAIRPAQRRGAALALAIAVATLLPLAAYALQKPDDVLLRVRQSATMGGDALTGAIDAWWRAWLERGDILVIQNLPGRPILDLPTAILFAAGLIGLVVLRRPKPAALIAALAAISLMPSLLSEYPPHFLRAIGLTVPIALVLGVGAEMLRRAIVRLAARRSKSQAAVRSFATSVPVGLFLIAAASTYRDFGTWWLADPRVPINFEQPLDQGVRQIEQWQHGQARNTPVSATTRLYMAPFEAADPFVRFAQARLRPLPVGGFDSANCLLVPDGPAMYLIRANGDPNSQAVLAAWGRVEPLVTFGAAQSAIALVRVTIDEGALVRAGDRAARFGAIEVRSDAALQARLQPGATASWQLRSRALQPLDRPYSLFLHLYPVGADGAIDDGRILAQGDRQLCASYPTVLWQPDEVAVQTYNLALPPDLPAGDYVVAMGVYGSDTGERLSASSPTTGATSSYTPLQYIRIEP